MSCRECKKNQGTHLKHSSHRLACRRLESHRAALHRVASHHAELRCFCVTMRRHLSMQRICVSESCRDRDARNALSQKQRYRRHPINDASRRRDASSTFSRLPPINATSLVRRIQSQTRHSPVQPHASCSLTVCVYIGTRFDLDRLTQTKCLSNILSRTSPAAILILGILGAVINETKCPRGRILPPIPLM